jgi:hypothetical protein
VIRLTTDVTRATRPVLRLLVAAALLLAVFGLATGPARAQTLSLSSPSLGDVGAAASGTTDFTFAPNGSVSVSGLGGRTTTSTGSVRGTLTITCTGGPSNDCRTKDIWVQIQTTGSPTGRAGPLSNFTMELVGGTSTSVAVLEGPTQVNSTTTRMRLASIGKDKTAIIYFGATLPIYGDESSALTGAASSPFSIATATATGGSPASAGGSASVTVFRSLSVSKLSNLEFGRVVRPSPCGGCFATIRLNSTGTRAAASPATWLTSPASLRAAYQATGQGGKQLYIDVPASFTMAKQGGSPTDTITVTTNKSFTGTPALSSGASGTYTFFVGGEFKLYDNTASGSYSGVFSVVVAYN